MNKEDYLEGLRYAIDYIYSEAAGADASDADNPHVFAKLQQVANELEDYAESVELEEFDKETAPEHCCYSVTSD